MVRTCSHPVKSKLKSHHRNLLTVGARNFLTRKHFFACRRGFKTLGGYRQHRNAIHIEPPRPTRPRQHPFINDEIAPEEMPQGTYFTYHPVLDGTLCDAEGFDLPPDKPPDQPPDQPPNHPSHPEHDTWHPFPSHSHFELADFIFRRNQMPAKQIDDLMQVLAHFDETHSHPPFNSDTHLYDSIDSISSHDVQWQSLSLQHPDFEILQNDPDAAPWKRVEYDVWYHDPRELLRNQLSNPEFAGGIDYAPQQVFGEQGQWVWTDLMTGNLAWGQCNTLADDPDCHGAMFVLVILGSDKTTVSVATGQNDYYPLYISAGNLHNNIRCAHRESVSLVGFLSIPKTERGHNGSKEFRNFRCHLFHASLRAILESFHNNVKCADSHYQRAVYGLGPYIADYPEQLLLSCIVQNWCPCGTADPKNLDGTQCGRRSHLHTRTLKQGFSALDMWFGWGIIDDILSFTAYFPRADIHELLAPDILHQIIKGTFKDHLVKWVDEYLVITYGEAQAQLIWADIDHHIAVVPSFPGDDSKALMKVFLPAIAGHVPDKMVQAISAFLDFCYIVRRSSLDEGVRPNGISLPRQHSLCHYRHLIQQFGAPNGLCSSLTESKHCKAVKEPWRRSSGYLALGQMLVTNQCLDKLAQFWAEKFAAGLLSQPLLPTNIIAVDSDSISDLDDENCRDDGDLADAFVDEEDKPEVIVQLAKTPVLHHPTQLQAIGQLIGVLNFHDLMDVSLCPDFNGRVHVFSSAVASFYAPSDICGVNGMLRHIIRSTPTWCNGPARHDCVFVEHDPTLQGFKSLYVAQVILFFSFYFWGVDYPCALVRWFETIGDQPHPNTEFDANGQRLISVIHLDTILRPAHLIPVYGNDYIDHDMQHSDSLLAFVAFYVNKFSDYHAFEIAF
ncbi:uncharacterized protein F5891DRAFT_1124515 [Suillus fuscotomentosus]|uniref:Transposase n=1 Tax=Suillus fuscotomentosus TaxID=1912939 RepID=A0AAD4HUG8_9AGAM|nr:uncharacterized protein F5891DRAFT_1124515 [Suillus fuscotomentosus]KAG1907604.1 hypothetical protein F5891DRAFT_1124515 [Suillus fuscotomentosus]